MRLREQTTGWFERGRGLLRASVVQNIISLYALYCSGYLLALVTVPYLGRVLGPESWGLLAFSQSFGGYLLLLMEYGFSLSATREVARNRDAPDKLSELLAAVLGAKLALALFSLGVCLLIQPHVPVFRERPELLWAALFLAVMQGSSVLWYFQGVERMQLAVGLDALMKTLAVGSIFVIVRKPGDAWEALALQGAGSALSLALTLGLAYRELPFRWPRPAKIVETLRHGLTVFIPRNALMMYTVGNSFILGLFAPPHIVGYYAGADRISRALVGLLGPVSDGIYPRISATVRRSRREALMLFRATLALVGSTGVVMAIGTFAFAPLLVRVVLGPGYEPAGEVLRILAAVAMLKAFGNVLGINWMLPLGLDRIFTAIVITAGVVNVGLAVFLAPTYAHIGMAWAVVVAQAFATLATYVALRWLRLDPLRRPREEAEARASSSERAQPVEFARGEGRGGRPVKVLHVVGHSRFGGGAVIIVEVAEMARALGCQVDVLTNDPAFQQLLRARGLGVVEMDVIWRSIRPLRDLRGLWRLSRFLSRSDYTVVHTHTSKAGLVGRVAAWMAGTPVILHTIHGFAFHEASHPLVVRACAVLEKFAGWCCDRIVVVARFHRDWALRLRIAGESKLVAIPNGIGEERTRCTEDPLVVRRRLGAAARDLVLLSTGRLAAGKGIEDVLAVLKEVARQSERPVKLWLAGDGPLRAELETAAARAGLDGIVSFLGFQREVGPLLAASDIVVLPTIREGLSIALLEAMAAAKAVVTTSIGSNREVVRDGLGALLVPPRDRGALRDAILRLARDGTLAAQLGWAARRIYLDEYTQTHMLDRYREQYRRLLDNQMGWRSRMPVWERAAKRALDVAGAAAALVLFSPLLLLLALAVRLNSRGPALFRQARLGRRGVPFTLYKFRTMAVDAPDLRNSDGSTYNAPDDPRVTRVGRWLRATSLDELPQLLNVLKGDMSLVGPRPDQTDQVRYYSPEDRRKLVVRPGLTGLAQLNGRNSIPWEQRKRLDLAYVARQSLRGDLAILLKTVPYVLKRKDIYVTARAER